MAGFVIASPKSGSGKTMVVCGLLEAARRRGLSPWAFKCGPDYIDGLFHRQVLGVDGGNLDSFFEGKRLCGQRCSASNRSILSLRRGQWAISTAWEAPRRGPAPGK